MANTPTHRAALRSGLEVEVRFSVKVMGAQTQKRDVELVTVAAQTNDVPGLQGWLSNGDVPNCYNRAGWTPLLIGAVRGHTGIVVVLTTGQRSAAANKAEASGASRAKQLQRARASDAAQFGRRPLHACELMARLAQCLNRRELSQPPAATFPDCLDLGTSDLRFDQISLGHGVSAVRLERVEDIPATLARVLADPNDPLLTDVVLSSEL